ncbi:hypothetical protein B7934_08425 [Streptococcus agalactiae]|nr:hypothetical protein B7934_08425 [Streptococcus agalactiae]
MFFSKCFVKVNMIEFRAIQPQIPMSYKKSRLSSNCITVYMSNIPIDSVLKKDFTIMKRQHFSEQFL